MKTHDERGLYNKDGRTGVVDVERERRRGEKIGRRQLTGLLKVQGLRAEDDPRVERQAGEVPWVADTEAVINRNRVRS